MPVSLLRGLAPILLLASWPFVAFLAANQGQSFRHQDVFAAWAATVAVACGAGWVIAVVFWRASYGRVGLLVGALVLIFFLLRWPVLSPQRGGHTIWDHIAAFVAMRFLGRWLACLERITLLMGSSGHAGCRGDDGCDFRFASLGFGLLSPSGAAVPGKSEVDPEQSTARPFDATHNVHWLLLDGYVRGDSLTRYFGHDNEPFLEALESRGFDIARSAYSNYDNTSNSLSSTLTMQYIYLPGRERTRRARLHKYPLGFQPRCQEVSGARVPVPARTLRRIGEDAVQRYRGSLHPRRPYGSDAAKRRSGESVAADAGSSRDSTIHAYSVHL